jgi:hypothetical protein
MFALIMDPNSHYARNASYPHKPEAAGQIGTSFQKDKPSTFPGSDYLHCEMGQAVDTA